MRRVLARRPAVLLLGSVILSCTDSGVTGVETSEYQILVTPSSIDARQGTVIGLQAKLVDRQGRDVAGAASQYRIDWVVSDTALLQVTATGGDAVATLVGAGTGYIEVSATTIASADLPGVQASKPTKRVNVRSAAVPGRLEVASGNNQQGTPGGQLGAPIVVRLVDRKGTPLMGARVDFVPQSGQDVATPSSTQTDINGYAQTVWRLGPETGEKTLRVHSAEVSDVTVTALVGPPPATSMAIVSGNGQTAQPAQTLTALQVKLTDSSGSPVAGAAVAWTVTTGGGTISPASATTDSAGEASAVWTVGPSVGTHNARATHGSLVADFTAAIRAGAPAQLIRVSGNNQSAATGARLPDSVTARVLDAYGNNVPGATVAWIVTLGGGSVSPAQGTTSATGEARAAWTMGTVAGSATLRAEVQGATSVSFTATALDGSAPPPPPAVRSVIVSPSSVALEALGATATLTATALDSAGVAVPGAEISWTSSNSAVAVVDMAGKVTARGVGTALVIGSAPCCGVADTAVITVTQKVAQLDVSPDQLGLVPGGTGVLSATARDANGNVIASPSLTWSSSNTGVATVANGAVTAVATGSAAIRAASGTVRDSTIVTVTNPAPQVSRVEVTPSSAVLEALAAQVTLAGVSYDANGQVVFNAQLRWSTSNSNIATVDTMGRVTARAVGTALIVATSVCCGAADTTNVEVLQRVASLDVSPATLALAVGGAQALSVTARDANQNTIASPSITWSSTNTAVATVSGGVVTGVAPGNAVIRAASGDVRDSSFVSVTSSTSSGLANECATPQSAWVWCDDFSQDRLSSYFEYDNASGRFVREAATGVSGSTGMRATFNAGQSGAGSLKLAFGATPSSYFRAVDAGTARYREIYWRVFLRNAPDWSGGGGDKLSRAIVFASSNWAEAAIGHVWSGGTGHNYLALDPASGTDTQGNLRTTQYNDFANLRWLGARVGTTALFSSANVGQWRCIETRMRLNDAGQSNGVFEMWIDGRLDAQVTGLNWVGSYSAYGINAVLLENFWNAGSPKQQSRYIDNFVVSTQPIGCGGSTVPPPPPPSGVESVTVSPASATLTAGETRTFTAVAKDAAGATLSGKTFTWSSSNQSVVSVSASGLVTALQTGTATITAEVDGKSGTSSVTVTSVSSSPWLEMNFDGYSSTAELMGDCVRWNCIEQADNGRIILDTSVAPPGGTRSMRYHYRHGGDGCNSITIKRTLPAPARAQEIWAEFQARWSANFRTTNNACVPNDHKFIFGDTEADGNGRWAFYVGSDAGPRHTLMVERPMGPNGFLGAYYPNSSNGLTPADLWDGAWHTVRLYYRASSGPTTTDGAMKVWVDGRLIHSETGFATRTENGGRDYITGFSFSHNKDDGPANEDMYLWWGRIRYWQTNPGW